MNDQPRNNDETIYKAYILPHLEYCSLVLIGIGKTQTRKLKETNYYMLRTLLGSAKGRNDDNIKHFIKILNETDLDMDIYLA